MNTVIVLITLMIALAMAATPLRPEVSETFEANINIEFVNSTISASGQGDEARNATGGQAVFRVEFTNPIFWIHELSRFDIGIVYKLDSTTNRNYFVKGGLPNHWTWLASATYTGQHSFRGQLVDWWNTSSSVSGITYTKAAAFLDSGSNIPSIPSFFIIEWTKGSQFERRTIGYDTFSPQVTNNTLFDIPQDCPLVS